MLDRRAFLSLAGCLLLGSDLFGFPQDWTNHAVRKGEEAFPVVEAKYYKKLDGGRVECGLCPNKCRVADRERGACGVRENRKGKYVTLIHSRVCAVHVDPIEKKPLFHYHPGTQAFSYATPGCNMWCKFCQNWQISQFRPEQIECVRMTPKIAHATAKRYDAPTIAATYTEPVVGTEFLYDIARLGEKTGIKSVMISNGFIEKEPMQDLLTVLDAVKVDLKAFSNRFYEEITGGKLKDILATLELVRKSGKWLEIVVLIIPTLNDSPSEITAMAKWIAGHLGPDVPVHFSRFYPTYRLKNLPVTPVRTLERCRRIAMKEGLHYVYIGNVPGHAGENTTCPKCGTMLIKRYGYTILENHLQEGKCPKCHTPIPGKWK